MTQEINGRKIIGTLKIPVIELELPVMEYSLENLKISACLYEGSLYENNMVICANNADNLFGRIKEMETGQLILFTDLENNRYIYQVKLPQVMNQSQDKKILDNLWNLTLLTYAEDESKRIVIRCIFL